MIKHVKIQHHHFIHFFFLILIVLLLSSFFPSIFLSSNIIFSFTVLEPFSECIERYSIDNAGIRFLQFRRQYQLGTKFKNISDKLTVIYIQIEQMDIETNTQHCSRRFGTELTNYTFQRSCKYSMMESEEVEPSVHGPLAPYLTHIQDYTHQQAQLTPHTHNYFQYQQQITPHMREVLVGWMVGVHRCMRLKEETLMMGVYLMDGYCVKRQVQKHNYQLLGVTTLFIAAKYHEITIPKLSSFVRVCEDYYSAGKILEMEGLILNAFDFQLSSFVLPHELVLNRLAVLLEHENPSTKATIEKVCMYLLNLTLLDHSFTHLQPSYLSAAIIYMGGKMKDTQYINSKIILNTYQLQTSIFRNYFNQLITLYSHKNDRKFEEISKKFKVVERCSYSHLY